MSICFVYQVVISATMTENAKQLASLPKQWHHAGLSAKLIVGGPAFTHNEALRRAMSAYYVGEDVNALLACLQDRQTPAVA
jgi:methanogenic corrinoid protein MtbC1